jgi:type I restriction enzyme S subunit
MGVFFSLPKNTLIVSFKLSLGRLAFTDCELYTNEAIAALYIKKESGIQRDYLYWFLTFFDWDACAGSDIKVKGKTLNKAKLKEINVTVPSITEQKRIVAILDQVFADIDKARATAERNLKNARELFESSCATSIFAVNSTANYIVEDVAKDEKGSMRTGPFGSQLLKREIVDEGIAVLGIDNAVNNYFQWGAKRFITKEKFEALSRFEVKPGDVLITIMGTCGRCAIVPNNIPKSINTKHICCITLDNRKCLPEYLHTYFLYHPIAIQYLLSCAKGAIMAGLNMGIIKELPLVLPSIEEQKELVSKVSKVSQLKLKIERLESTYRQKIIALDELKKSILQKAFTGELTKSKGIAA